MKKKIFILLLLIPVISFAQYDFFKTYNLLNKQQGISLIEQDGNIYVCGNDEDSKYTKALIIKFDRFGNITNSFKYFEQGFKTYATDLQMKNDTVLVFCKSFSDSSSHITFLKFTKNLQFISSKKASVGEMELIRVLTVFNDTDSNYIIGGDLQSIDSGYLYSGFLYKFNSNLDSLLFKKTGIYMTSNVTKNILNNQYYVFAETGGATKSKIIKFDNQFNFLKSDTIAYNIENNFCPIWLNNNRLIINGTILHSNHKLDQILFSIIDTNAVPEKMVDTGSVNVLDFNAWFKSMIYTDNNIYSAFTSNFNYYYQSYSTSIEPSYIGFVKLDTALNIEWVKYYGNDTNFYVVTGFIKTTDNGFAFTGFEFNPTNPIWITDIFLLKLDSLGNYTWIKTIEASKNLIEIYPNPAQDFINIQSDSPEIFFKEITLFSMQGKLIQRVSENSINYKMNIQNLQSGVYFIQIEDKFGNISQKKFIKN